MRELKVLDQGHFKLSWEERKEFFEEELGEHVRSEVKRLLEEAWEAERTHWLGVGRYVRDEGKVRQTNIPPALPTYSQQGSAETAAVWLPLRFFMGKWRFAEAGTKPSPPRARKERTAE